MNKITSVTQRIKPADVALMEKAQGRLDRLAKPQGSLGRLEELARRVIGMTGKESPPLTNACVFTLAGDHGVVDEGVSAFPREVTPQMVYNFIRGGAAINVLARHAGARVVVVDMGVAGDLDIKDESFRGRKVRHSTRNMAKEPAMTKDEAVRSVETGIDVFEEEYARGLDIVLTGDMGIGNTTASSAITAVMTGRPASEVTGRGTGIDDERLRHKAAVIARAIQLHSPDPSDGIDCLRTVGGYEIGGLAGIILAAAGRRVPVVLDGFIAGAAALIACAVEETARDYLIAAHASVERGHGAALAHLGLEPLFDLKLRLGEGTGAVLALHLIEAGLKIIDEMATFESAGVSGKDT